MGTIFKYNMLMYYALSMVMVIKYVAQVPQKCWNLNIWAVWVSVPTVSLHISFIGNHYFHLVMSLYDHVKDFIYFVKALKYYHVHFNDGTKNHKSVTIASITSKRR